MRISKIIVALLVSVMALTVMTGVAVADPEQVEILPEGATGDPEGQGEVSSPFMLNNDGSCNNLDLGFWDYLSGSSNGEVHNLTVWVTPISGSDASKVTLNVTERSGAQTSEGTGTVSLTWTQDTGGNDAWDYIDLCLKSDGPDGAQYQLHVADEGYNAGSGTADKVLENLEMHNVPEFATIAIPAIAVLGLFLFFNKRKHKKD